MICVQHAPIGEKNKQKHKVSDGMSSDTIFAFLMLNTPRSAHNKIFGAKFLSFECAAIVY